MSVSKTHVIFDLDGTLIDSSSSILQSFESAFRQLGVEATKPFTQEVIGPPLMPTLRMLSGSEDEALLKALAAAFKAEYDGHGYQLATVFDGIEAFLDRLLDQHVNMYIATNKRILPTRKIMQHLSWEKYFKEVYALDYFQPPLGNKKDMVTHILRDQALQQSQTIFIGDRIEDGMSAEGNGLDFAMVTWGYLDDSVGDIPAHWLEFSQPSALGDYLLASR